MVSKFGLLAYGATAQSRTRWRRLRGRASELFKAQRVQVPNTLVLGFWGNSNSSIYRFGVSISLLGTWTLREEGPGSIGVDIFGHNVLGLAN